MDRTFLLFHSYGSKSMKMGDSSIIYNVLTFLSYQCFTLFVLVTLRYFIFLRLLCKRQFSLFFSVCLFILYVRMTDFCELILYSAALLKFFSFSFFVWLQKFTGGIFRLSYVYYHIIYILTSSFPICISLISFSLLIPLAKTTRNTLTRYGERGQFCS